MKQTSKQIPLLVFSLILMIALAFAIVYLPGYIATVRASAPSGLSGTIASTTNFALVNGVVQTLEATSTAGCSARIISTASTSVMLTFSDKTAQSPSAQFGYWQAASTTVAYDSGLYGCGLVKVFPVGTGWITLSEVQ